jgi:hypothetical protein
LGELEDINYLFLQKINFIHSLTFNEYDIVNAAKPGEIWFRAITTNKAAKKLINVPINSIRTASHLLIRNSKNVFFF